ncbi:MAG: cytochrome C [Alphaproteobacteria bacterium HGW-Alphaproteobacteria-16]|nr:MAG: cytochrome C [Alphaproteobacteria bacterium HGW-Alphaproteobacteria-16]
MLFLAIEGVAGSAPAVARAAAAPVQAAPPPAFAQCRACHSVVKDGPSGAGPNLFGVGGAVAGSKPGYAYSPALKASNIRWDRAKLDAYIHNPRGLVPGTKMMAPPVTDAARRKAIVDYLVALK